MTSAARRALETASLPYRRPEFYAAMTDAGAPRVAAVIEDLIGLYGPSGPSSVLDVGCGTGAVLEHLAGQFPVAVGVDLLPGMVGFASVRSPLLDIRQGDMRTFRLGQQFDVVICVGNALAYMLTDDDLTAALTTFAEHCAPGGLLLVQTLVQAPRLDEPCPSRIVAAGREANVTVSYSLDRFTGHLITTRVWEFKGGQRETDVIRRRVLTRDELAVFADKAGFTPAGLDLPKRMTAFLRQDPDHHL